MNIIAANMITIIDFTLKFLFKMIYIIFIYLELYNFLYIVMFFF